MDDFLEIAAEILMWVVVMIARLWWVWIGVGFVLWWFYPGVVMGTAAGADAAIGIGVGAVMALLAEIFVFGGLGFWCLCAGVLGGMVWFTDREWPGCSFLLAAATAMVFYFGYGVNPVVWAFTHKQLALTLFVGYFVAGAVWMVIRWGFWVQTLMDKLSDHVESFVRINAETKALTKGTDEYKAALFKFLSERTPSSMGGCFPPKYRHHKGRILFWIGFWPFSAIWTLINEPIKKIAHFIYNRLTGVLGWITHQVIAWNLKGHI